MSYHNSSGSKSPVPQQCYLATTIQLLRWQRSVRFLAITVVFYAVFCNLYIRFGLQRPVPCIGNQAERRHAPPQLH
ncbi:hypothetical protein CCHOA_05340 [Corynebacterium choanae]|uniref:Uncharacterized protein n=1 Tax=Corynebacterium choanae TaxID=1862358 RepID=A0A3G6J6N1_9CORY|nr:hypothetical protein CCHOA_05340 [Corynebacterium choanae]